MTVDLSTLQPGDTVGFRCGGSVVVTKLYDTDHQCTGIEFFAFKIHFEFMNNGNYYREDTPHPFDIISITKKQPEEVKPDVIEVDGTGVSEIAYQGKRWIPKPEVLSGGSIGDPIFYWDGVNFRPLKQEEPDVVKALTEFRDSYCFANPLLTTLVSILIDHFSKSKE